MKDSNATCIPVPVFLHDESSSFHVSRQAPIETGTTDHCRYLQYYGTEYQPEISNPSLPPFVDWYDGHLALSQDLHDLKLT